MTRKRVDHARKLLRTSTAPLAEVALQCGFSSQSHMTTVFKGATGVTPAKFRATFRSPLYFVGGIAAINYDLLMILAGLNNLAQRIDASESD